MGGGKTSLNGQNCAGSVQALNPSTGAVLWQDCLDATVLGAVTATANTVYLTYNNKLGGYNESTGQSVYTFTGSGQFYSAVTAIPGHLLAGNITGTLYDLSW